MKTSEILQEINIPRHKLYYLEQKGYVTPKRIPMGDLEAREYSGEDLLKIKFIWKYLSKGFKHKVAYEMAMKEIASMNEMSRNGGSIGNGPSGAARG
jgi:DNA-binding transcriptional MerR regulator